MTKQPNSPAKFSTPETVTPAGGPPLAPSPLRRALGLHRALAVKMRNRRFARHQRHYLNVVGVDVVFVEFSSSVFAAHFVHHTAAGPEFDRAFAGIVLRSAFICAVYMCVAVEDRLANLSFGLFIGKCDSAAQRQYCDHRSNE